MENNLKLIFFLQNKLIFTPAFSHTYLVLYTSFIMRRFTALPHILHTMPFIQPLSHTSFILRPLYTALPHSKIYKSFKWKRVLNGKEHSPFCTLILSHRPCSVHILHSAQRNLFLNSRFWPLLPRTYIVLCTSFIWHIFIALWNYCPAQLDL